MIVGFSVWVAQHITASIPQENYTYIFSVVALLISIGSVAFPHRNLGILRGFSKRKGFTVFQKERLKSKVQEARKICWQVFFFGIFLGALIIIVRIFDSDFVSLAALLVAFIFSVLNLFGQVLLAINLDKLNDDFDSFLSKSEELRKMESSKN